MTIDEAISIMNVIVHMLEPQYDTDRIEDAVDMAIKALESIPKYKDAYGKGWDDGAKASYEHLKMCEEEQEPQTGQWIKDIDDTRGFDKVRFYCSKCNEWQSYGETRFCPSCGAKMVKV